MLKTDLLKRREKGWLAVLMASIAGFVDAVGYLSLFHLFTAHMSGNTAAMGAYLGEGRWGEALHRAFPIPMFILGVTVGTLLTEWVLRRGFRSPFSFILTLEALLLGILMLLGNTSGEGSLQTETGVAFSLFAALPAVAMGLQSATLRRIGRYRIRSTYITGMLTSLSEEGVKFIFWIYDQTRRRNGNQSTDHLRTSVRRILLNRIFLLGSLWLGFALGATLGGFAHEQWHLRSLAFPLCGLAFVIVADIIRPLYEPSRLDRRSA